ncbi:MAG TPA: efflux RND transporter periplasmic adaptor subunit [Ignavibacteria bacterium]|nr:efflux RND transporter periplasmic adaptor subunit [Ignavibacteria bacterium]HQY52729.1 efflux RND transporter periplasmic adaptor subunit [Ignavibacteria bacterium]HRB01025.1 efflux RND transporter periplasmic adaptor subunit [Ignavibacteria bacterium]
MNKTLIILITVLITTGLLFGAYKIFYDQGKTEELIAADELYICPMHPQIQSDHPGVCPICNMDLVLKEKTNTELEFDSLKNLNKEISDLVLSPAQQILANVQTEKVIVKEFKSRKSFNGYVKSADNNMRFISTPVSGKIVKMYINYEGQTVSKGQRVFDIYSPEIYSTQKEYLLALKNYESAKSSGNTLVIDQAESLINASKIRMSLWEITNEQISELEQSGEVKDFISVYSKYSGVVTKKLQNEGRWAMAGENILDITDLSTVWIIANVPESDLKNISMGQNGMITSVAYPGEVFNAKVNFISPVFNADSRSLEVRFDVTNRNYKLKPDMYVDVEIGSSDYQWNIVVPKNAVLRTGKMDMVYIKKSENLFSPKMVTVGGVSNGFYLITSGLSEGEEVVTSAGFLLDSESQIRSGSNMNNMEGMEMEVKGDPEFNKDQDVMKDIQEHKH